MDEILSHHPATQPLTVLNSMEEVVGKTTGGSASECTGDTAGDTASESQAEDRGNSSKPELEDIHRRGSSSSTTANSHSTTPLALQQKSARGQKEVKMMPLPRN